MDRSGASGGTRCYAAHMNLRDEYLPFRYIIGQVMLDVSLPFVRLDCISDWDGGLIDPLLYSYSVFWLASLDETF